MDVNKDLIINLGWLGHEAVFHGAMYLLVLGTFGKDIQSSGASNANKWMQNKTKFVISKAVSSLCSQHLRAVQQNALMYIFCGEVGLT